MDATFWALMPPVVAIVLALITKEVYVSLLIGILAGGLFYAILTCWMLWRPPLPLWERTGGKQHKYYRFPGAFGNAGSFDEQIRGFEAYGSWASRQ